MDANNVEVFEFADFDISSREWETRSGTAAFQTSASSDNGRASFAGMDACDN